MPRPAAGSMHPQLSTESMALQCEPLARLVPVRLRTAGEPEQVALWNQSVQRYHALAYRQPLGVHLRYWVRDRSDRLLGCLLFDRPTRRLTCRDCFIGWRRLNRMRLHP